jgi:hypothetical protein
VCRGRDAQHCRENLRSLEMRLGKATVAAYAAFEVIAVAGMGRSRLALDCGFSFALELSRPANGVD